MRKVNRSTPDHFSLQPFFEGSFFPLRLCPPKKNNSYTFNYNGKLDSWPQTMSYNNFPNPSSSGEHSYLHPIPERCCAPPSAPWMSPRVKWPRPPIPPTHLVYLPTSGWTTTTKSGRVFVMFVVSLVRKTCFFNLEISKKNYQNTRGCFL